MSEKNKLLFKKTVIFILVFVVGVFIGVMAVKGSENYKDTCSLSERLTFDSYHILTSLDSAFDNELSYDRIYEDIKDLGFVSSLAIGSNGVFLVGYDEDISYDELNILFECSVKAKIIARDLAIGKEISSEDMEWFKKFGVAVDTAYAFGPNYRTLVESLVEQGLYETVD